MKKKWRLILGILLALIIIGVMVAEALKPLEAELLTVERGSIAKTFQEKGLVQAAQETKVYTPYGGKVTRLNIQEGDQVEAGTLLLTFDSQELSYQIQNLKAQIRSIEAQKDLQELTIDLETMKLLYEAGIITQKEYEEAENTLNSDYYPALISGLKAQIDQINYQIAQGRVVSPLNGTVAELNIEQGMVVAPGTPLMTILSDSGYKVECHVLTEDAPSIQTGMEVTLIQDNRSGDRVFSGAVEKIAAKAEESLSALGLIEQRLKITIVPTIPEDVDLKPGYALDVVFTIDKQDDQLIVPKTTLFPYNDGYAVWVVRDGKAEIQPVQKGMENERDTAIVEGLQEGDLVILNPKLEGLKEGQSIKPL
ncbi:MAG: efflux RND transporter periplasmic adaptor subunit [Peptococcaceae bacterium]|nr:efflux RND transporter periplasmic adaptor subunit [Peptococcaceae bacterium]